jgi:hypothetical protein
MRWDATHVGHRHDTGCVTTASRGRDQIVEVELDVGVVDATSVQR